MFGGILYGVHEMPLIIPKGNEMYTIAKEVYSRTYAYYFSTKYALGIDLFVRLTRDERFNEKEFLEEIIDVFNDLRYPSKHDLKPFLKKYGMIADGLNYNQMNEHVYKLIEKALERGYKVEYAYDGVNIGGKGLLVELKRYDPNLGVFTKVFLNNGGEKKKWVGRDIADNYEDIMDEIISLL